jgi:Fur family iron response transcriptional regulator
LALARLLLENGERHVTAEQLHGEAVDAGIPVSLATIYNTLHQFTDCGLLHEVVVEPGRSYFATNTTDHHHFFWRGDRQAAGHLGSRPAVTTLPPPPRHRDQPRVDVIIRVRPESSLTAASIAASLFNSLLIHLRGPRPFYNRGSRQLRLRAPVS